MQITAPNTEIYTSGGKNVKMRISVSEEAEAFMQGLLRKGIYKNPKGAIAREIASNGRDSHREGGNPNERIEIEITDNRNNILHEDGLNITFRDFGTGLSPEMIENIYSQYGESTKRHTNTLTGGFGLGAKTPFAYLDAFTVKTVFNGIEYAYSIFIDAKGLGAINLMYKETLSGGERNMTEVVVPISNDDDRRIFEREVIKSTYFWEIRPTLKGFRSDYMEFHAYAGFNNDPASDNIILVLDGFLESNINVIIDGIYYPVDMTMFKKFDKIRGSDIAICLKYENGVLPVTASRENIQYEDSVIESITARVDAIMDALGDMYQEKISSVENFYAAMVYFGVASNRDRIFNSIRTTRKFYYEVSGVQRELSDRSETLKTIALTKVIGSRTETGKARENMVSDVFSTQLESSYRKCFLADRVRYAQKNKKLSVPITKAILEDVNDFLAVVQIGYEDAKLTQPDGTKFTVAEFEAAQDEETKRLESYGFKWEQFYDVPPLKMNYPDRRRRDKLSIKIFANEHYDNKVEMTHDDGVLMSHGVPQNIIYYYQENEVTIDNSIKRRLKDLSRLADYLVKGTKIAICSKAKIKYFSKCQHMDAFFTAHKDKIFQQLAKEEYSNEIYQADNLKRLTFPADIQDVLEELRNMRKLPSVGMYGWSAYLQEINLIFVKDKGVVYEEALNKVEERYPEIHNLPSNFLPKYIEMVDKVASYEELLGIN